jgi:type IV secretory pathway VirB9-like protein
MDETQTYAVKDLSLAEQGLKNIEFAEREEIQTLSIGDQIGWQVVPAGRYLFIKAMQKIGKS